MAEAARDLLTGGARFALLVVAAAVAVGASGLPAAASGSSICELAAGDRPAVTEPAELCGVTTVDAAGSAVVRVRITETLEIRPEEVRTELFEVASEGSVAGFALVPEQEELTNGMLVGGRIDVGAAADTVFLHGTHRIFGTDTYRGAPLSNFMSPLVLSPGTYRLSLFTDQGGIRLTLLLAGLRGWTEFEATTPNGAVARVLETGVPAPAPDLLSTTEDLAAPGLTIGASFVDTEAMAAAQYLLCRRRNMPEGGHACGDDDPQDQKDDPGLTIYNDRGDPSASPTERLLVHSSGLNPSGPFALGFGTAVEGVALNRAHAAVWLPVFVPPAG